MLLLPSKQPKYLQLLKLIKTKYSETQLRQLNGELAPVPASKKPPNPFLTDSFSAPTAEQLGRAVLNMAKQMDSLALCSLNALYLQKFIESYFQRLITLLTEKAFHCNMFCYTIIRYLQECELNPSVRSPFSEVPLRLLDLFYHLLQSRKAVVAADSKRIRENGNAIHNVFCVLMLLASIKYISSGQNKLREERYVTNALRMAGEMIEQAETTAEFEILREFLVVSSHLLLFNGLQQRPVNFIEFCLGEDQQLRSSADYQEVIQEKDIEAYFLGLRTYMTLDPKYQTSLLAIIKKFISLNINSPCLMQHFSLAVSLIQGRTFPLFNSELHVMLIEAENSKNTQLIDDLYLRVMEIDSDRFQQEIQRYNLVLAKNGSLKRKECFINAYRSNYSEAAGKVQEDTVNFIIETFLSQQLALDNIEAMIVTFSQAISSTNLHRIHQRLGEQKYLELLSAILHKRTQCFIVNRLDSSSPFVEEAWLAAVGRNHEIYKIYLKITVTMLCGNHSMFSLGNNFDHDLFHIQEEHRSQCIQSYQILLHSSLQAEIFDEQIFRYIVICQAILGEQLQVQTYSYFSKHLEKCIDPSASFLKFLENLLQTLKNSSALVLYLHALLEWETLAKDVFYHKQLYRLDFLTKMMEESQFFRLSAYSLQAVALLYELSLKIEDKAFHQSYFKLMALWSTIITKNEAKHLNYFFVFREIKKIYPFLRQSELEEPLDRLKELWKLILFMLNQTRPSNSFLLLSNNKFTLECREELSKKKLKLEGALVKNKLFEYSWSIAIETTIKTYKITINNTKMSIDCKIKPASKSLIKQSQRSYAINGSNQILEVVQFSLQLQSHKEKDRLFLTFKIMQSCHEFQLQGDIQLIELLTPHRVLLKSIKIVDFTTPCTLHFISSHIHTLGQWLIKTQRLNILKTHSFAQKFDFQHAYCYFGEMLRHFQHLSFPFVYELFAKLSFKMIRYIQKEGLSKRPAIIIQTFSRLEQSHSELRGKGRELSPQIELENAGQYARPLYHLLVSAFLPKVFWGNFCKNSKQGVQALLQLLRGSEQFRSLENNRLDLFERCLQLAREEPYFMQTCDQLISSHPLNHVLTFKFKRFLFLAKENVTFEASFSGLVNRTTQYLQIENIRYSRQREHCKFTIINFECLQRLFPLCSIDNQMTIIHYLTQNPPDKPTLFSTIHTLTLLISTHQKNQLLSWLIVQLKQLFFEIKIRKISIFENEEKLTLINFYLELIFFNHIHCSEVERDDLMKVVEEGLTLVFNSLKIEKGKFRYEKLFNAVPYAKMLKDIELEIICKYENKHEMKLNKKKDVLLRIEDALLQLVTCKFSKKTFLSFMIHLRVLCCGNKRLILAFINHEQFGKLKLYHFSIFLQFVVEILTLLEKKSPFSEKESKELASYVLYFLENLIPKAGQREHVVEIPKHLFYSYPHLACTSYYASQTRSQVLAKFRNIENREIAQLNGGVYFKCVLILIKLMRILPQEDYSALVEYFLFGLPKPPSKFSSTLGKVQEFRHAIDRYLSDVSEQHKFYSFEWDMALLLQAESISLNSYIVDYFLMNLSEYLQLNAFKLNATLTQKYTAFFIQSCQQECVYSQTIYSHPNPERMDTYEAIVACLLKENSNNTNKEIVSDINENGAMTKSRGQSAKFAYEVRNGFTSPRLKKKKTEEEFSEEFQKKLSIFKLVKSDPKNWFKEPDCKHISSFFCEKAKEIRTIELLHTHFVLTSSGQVLSSSANTNFRSESESFRREYDALLKKELSQVNKTSPPLEEKARKVKKIHPYTCRKVPVVRIIENCLSNMTCPITTKFIVDEYEARYCQSHLSINMDYYLQHQVRSSQHEANNQIKQEIISTDQFLEPLHEMNFAMIELEEKSEEKEMSVEENTLPGKRDYCELITREGAYFCQYEIKKKSLILTTRATRPQKQLWYLKFGTPDNNIIPVEGLEISIALEQSYEIIYRKYNQITSNSIEIFFRNGTSRFLSLYTKRTLAAFLRRLQLAVKGLRIIRDPVKYFEDMKYAEKWQEGCLSNFDYLMLLNRFSGRTYNDLNQYPVFPWILQDYSSPALDLSDPQNYRDLDKPIGALNQVQLQECLEKYYHESLSERCLYRSHYSTEAFVFYFLFRLEPYSSLYRKLQNNKWDDADRLFHSISQVWTSLTDKKLDVKECIPEFYYFPTFLKNVSHIEFGKKQSGKEVSDVELPAWCSSPEQFILTHRAALDGDHVSENLHLWIDLIFGKHQNSIEKFNVFRPISYADPEIYTHIRELTDAQVKGHVTEISYFGQCPLQLFKKEHKPKNSLKMKKKVALEVSQECALPNGWRITRLDSDQDSFYLEVATQKEKQWISFPILATNEEMKNSLRNLTPIKRKQAAQPMVELSINSKQELFIGSELLMELQVHFEYSHTATNEIWVACFGCSGIKVYSWQLVEHWAWLDGEVKEVLLEPTRLIFSTPTGRLYFYSFLDRQLREEVVFSGVCDMKMKTVSLPRLPNLQKNLIHYSILCVGEERRVSLVHQVFQERWNYTSQLHASTR